MDLKAIAFEKIWTSHEIPHHTHTALLQVLRQQAKATEATAWTVEDLDKALQGEPDRGQGVDRINCSDIRRLPKEGRQAIVDLFNECEVHLMWPWQLLCSVVMGMPKPAKGDRALALLPQLVRT